MNRKNDRKKTSIIGTNGRQANKWNRPTSVSIGLSSDSLDSCLNGVNNLRPKCEQTFRVILSNPTTDCAVNAEKQLWNDIKEYRHQKDIILIDYLIGFYVSLLESVLIYNRRKDPYILLSKNCSQLSTTVKLLLYNFLIRIGDLNRYLNKTSIAETYYLNARKLDVMRGHAYNQLAIVTPLTEPFKCIYYSVRAAKSCVEPIIIAETNLKVAVNRFNCNILKKIIKSSNNINREERHKEENELFPERGIDWFYLSVISIYSENFKPIFKPLIEYMIINAEVSNNKLLDNNNFNFSLMAFDVSLDWINLKDMKKIVYEEYAKELKELKSKLTNCLEVLNKCENRSDNSLNDYSDSKTVALKALFHDYILRGFSPLKEIHQSLAFDSNEVLVIELYSLLIRVNDKLNKLFGKSLKPKKMRNVALGSILESQFIDS